MQPVLRVALHGRCLLRCCGDGRLVLLPVRDPGASRASRLVMASVAHHPLRFVPVVSRTFARKDEDWPLTQHTYTPPRPSRSPRFWQCALRNRRPQITALSVPSARSLQHLLGPVRSCQPCPLLPQTASAPVRPGPFGRTGQSQPARVCRLRTNIRGPEQHRIRSASRCRSLAAPRSIARCGSLSDIPTLPAGRNPGSLYIRRHPH